jgi:hypothetical protein
VPRSDSTSTSVTWISELADGSADSAGSAEGTAEGEGEGDAAAEELLHPLSGSMIIDTITKTDNFFIVFPPCAGMNPAAISNIIRNSFQGKRDMHAGRKN